MKARLLGVHSSMLIIWILILGFQHTTAQHTDWINFEQTYYKIPTGEDGIHRLYYDQLAQVLFPFEQVNTSSIQIFHRGVEQAITVSDNGDSRLDPGDYIEFYGRKNDGFPDRELYVTPEAQPHAYYNLYSDSTAYFLTWNPQNSGKRMTVQSVSNTGNNQVQYHTRQDLLLATSNYSPGRRYPVGGGGATYRTQFDFGEGFTGSRIRNGNFEEFEIGPVDLPYNSGPSPRLEVLLAGRNEVIHNVEILAGVEGNLRSLGKFQFQFFDNYLFTSDLSWSDIPTGSSLSVRVSVTSNSADQVSVSYVKLSYPELLDMQNLPRKRFEVGGLANDQSAEITSTGQQTKFYNITDPNNVKILEHLEQGSSSIITIPASGASTKILAEQTPIQVPLIAKTPFRNIDPARHDYLIITHDLLRRAGGNYQDPVQAYAEYRASEAGGNYDTLIVDMDLLYDQFNYGEISPLAVRHFVAYMLPGSPQYLLLVGKGYNVNFNPYRQDPITATTMDLVPTAGFPGSDIALTAGLGNSVTGAAIPTGRVNARSAAEVAAYLDKLIEMEAAPFNSLWRKNLLHLSGGLTQNELVLFKRYVDQFKSVAEGPFLGGQVTTIEKQSNEATVLINVADEVNKGVSLITFFGHSSTQVTDIEIGKVTDVTLGYDNAGRYPLILVNGCNAGNIFFSSIGFGEDWILAPNKGAVGFLAHTDAGFAGNLKRYSDIFYDLAFGDSVYMSKPIGNIIQELGNRYLDGLPATETHIAQVQQEVFQGDPAFSLFPVDKPDYETNNDQVFLQSFDGSSINAQIDSFQVGIITRNFGRTSRDSLNVTVRRTFDDNQVLLYDSVFFAPVPYQDTLYFTIRSNQINNFGNNQFEVLLDYNQSIDELDETNNSGTLNFFIPQGGTSNLSPFEFAIIDQSQPVLISQASNLLTGKRNFLFEIDTTSNFNSPFTRTQSIPADGIASWQVDLLTADSTVYYWRTRFQEPRSGEDTTWTLSSFIYIPNSPEGWSQAQFSQFDGNATDQGIDRNQATRKWVFSSIDNLVEITTYGSDNPQNEPANISVTIDGQPYIVSTRLCPDNSFNAIAFDQASTIPYAVLTDGGFDVLDRNRCGRTPQVINTFQANDINNELKLDEYLDQLSDRDYVVMFSIGEVDYASWNLSTREKLTSVGISINEVSEWQSGQPVIIVGRKGDPVGSAGITTGNTEEQISISHILQGRYDRGVIISPRIGPAASWGALYHQIQKESNDQTTLELMGITQNGIEQVLNADVPTQVLDLSNIDPLNYPYLRLKLSVVDQISLTPAQLKRWQVTYETLPEGVLLFRGNEANKTEKIPLLEGEALLSNFTFFNLTDKQFQDSLQVRSTLFNREQRTTTISESKIAAVPAQDSIKFTLNIDSKGLGGINDYRVFVNPNVLPERSYANNINDFLQYLEVATDDTHPILDVTFDGIYILDGDIVSPSPVIAVLLKDDNQFNLKQDTIGMELFIKQSGPDCVNCEFQRISFSNPRVKWTPATEKSDFRIEYQPEKLEDGIYTLRVQGQDNSGRKSGTQPYTINFEVINESTITNFYPYPNPFSTSTRFVFTLTGAEIPDRLKIQIMTVTGKVVREITQDELGVIRIGNNITDYAWDGRDEYGDQLANGVYIYRVVMDRDLDSFKHRETSADKAFKKGYGKLYLLR